MRYWFEGIEELVEYPRDIINIRTCKVKSFPTCKTCPKLSIMYVDDNPYCTLLGVIVDLDWFCADHPDFAKE